MQTIVKNIPAISGHPYENLSLDLRCALTGDAAFMRQASHQVDVPIVLLLLECCLQLIGQRLCASDVRSDRFSAVSKIFTGALLSESFISLSTSRRYRYCRVWQNCNLLLSTKFKFIKNKFDLNISLDSIDCISSIEDFLSSDLNQDKIEYWRAWPAYSQSGQVTYLPLLKIHQTMGKNFTCELYEACKTYIGTKRRAYIPGIKEFSEYIESLSPTPSREDFQDKRYAHGFFTEFRRHFFVTRYSKENGSSLKTLSNEWRYSIHPFLQKVIIDNRIITSPEKGLPLNTPPFDSLSETHVRRSPDGTESNLKLTTPIPLEVNDDEAIEILFERLSSDISAIEKWATQKIKASYARFKTAEELGQIPFEKDIAKTHLIPKSKEYLHYISRTLHEYGHITDIDKRLASIYPRPLTGIAELLGTPTNAVLLPYACLLIIRHPQITPDFLRKLSLYDKRGRLTALVKQDGATYLQGYKFRRGSKLAEQNIKLTQDSLYLIEQIIEITTHARNHLRIKNDDTWRKLFITCGKGFGYPKVARCLFGERDNTAIAADIMNHAEISSEHASTLANQLTLASLRATCAVTIYIEKESLSAASKALGHKELSRRLIKRYIPKPLLDFFQNRWIRIFQQAIIIHALKDSPKLLEATDLKSAEEIAQFLSNHSLRAHTKPQETEKTQHHSLDENSEIIFQINTEILTAMLTLCSQDESSVSPAKSKYWMKISKHLIDYIDSPDCLRPDFRKYIEKARQKISQETGGLT